MFKDLTPEEEKSYRQWARDNYEKLALIQGVWHPIVQDECVRMNTETEHSAHFSLEEGLEASGFERVSVPGLEEVGIIVMRGK